MQPGQRIELTADRLDDDGRGVATVGDRELHVAGLLPGERGSVEVEHVSPHAPAGWGRLVELLSPPAAERVTPACPAFGRCGGCAWQHLAYPAQLDAKTARVRAALAGFDAPVAECVPAPRELGYRNLGKYVVGRGPTGALTLGAYLPRTHELVPTLGCRVVTPAIDAAATLVAEALADADLTPYDERTRTGAARYVIIRANADDELLVGLVTTTSAPRASVDRVAAALELPGLRGVVWVRNDSTGGAILTEDRAVVRGEDRLPMRIGAVELDVALAAFFQINAVQAARMYGQIADEAGLPGTALDVYCGVGGIALTLAHRGWRVVGLERDRDAVAAATAAARRQHLPARFERGDARRLADLAAGVDLIVVNPPRKGLDGATRDALATLGPRRLAYLSCNPDSLARDLRELGAELARAQPFDLMPGTGQVETLALVSLPTESRRRPGT